VVSVYPPGIPGKRNGEACAPTKVYRASVDESLQERLAVIVIGYGDRAPRAQRAADLIRTATSARWVGIYTVADGQVTNEAWSGPAAPAYPSFAVSEGLTSYAIADRAPVVSDDVAADPRYLTNQDDSGSELIVPVLGEGDRSVIGTLDIESEARNAFDEAGVRDFETIARQLRPLWTASEVSPSM
jgi:putative methionine-R-sulfoxide reductase with GAF domain